MFSGHKSARSDAGARFAASVSGNTGVEVFSGKTGKPRVSNLRPCCRFCQRKVRAGLAVRWEGGQRDGGANGSGGAKEGLANGRSEMGIVASRRAIQAATF